MNSMDHPVCLDEALLDGRMQRRPLPALCEVHGGLAQEQHPDGGCPAFGGLKMAQEKFMGDSWVTDFFRDFMGIFFRNCFELLHGLMGIYMGMMGG